VPSLLELIELVYAGIENGEIWEGFLDSLARVIPFDHSSLQIFCRESRTPALQMHAGLDSTAARAYQEHFCHLNPWIREHGDRIANPVHDSESILPFDAYQKSAFYQEFGARNHIAHSVACNVSDGEDGTAVLSLTRRHSTGAFTESETGVIRMLAPHLRRAVRMRGRLAEWHTALAIQGALAPAHLVLDERLRVRDASPGAEAFLRTSGMMSLRKGSLSIAAEYSELFRSLVRGERHSATLRDDSGRPQPIRAIPLPGSASPGGGRLTVLVFASPGSGDWSRRLATDFGLTPAEIRLTLALLESDSLARAAEPLGISINTAKTQLASIFRRTGVRSQKELAQLAARLGAP
jgi:DNA-binding CsgD family transcriptional regulator